MSLSRVLKRAWFAWVSRCAQKTDPMPQALTRVFLGLCVVFDLVRVGQLGLVQDFFRSYEYGGLSQQQFDRMLWITEVSPEWGGLVAWGLCLLCALLVVLGVAVRPSIVVFLVLYAQLGHLYPPGDRAIDRLIRTAMLILLFSGAHRAFRIRGGDSATKIPAWPVAMITFVLVLMYMSAGIHKVWVNPQWLAWTGDVPLYRILTDPMSGKVDAVWAADWMGIWRVLGWFTILFEIGSFLLLTRWGRWWALLGLTMHLGLVFTMHLGMFSWAMLAFYPILLGPKWVRKAADKVGIHSRSLRQRFL